MHDRARADTLGQIDLTGFGARLLLVLFTVTQVALAFASGGTADGTWQSILALVAVVGTATLLVLPGAFPLRLAAVFVVLGAVIVSTVLVTWQITPGQWPGYGAWHLGANTFLLTALALRGRIRAAWIGMGLMIAITILWTTTTGQGVMHGLDLVNRQASTLVIGTLFAFGLSRTARRIAAFNRAEDERATDDAAARASIAERNAQADRLVEVAGAALGRLAAGDTTTEAERIEMLVLEATLRDTIRARYFVFEQVLSSVREARRRGVNVVLLDDSDAVQVDVDRRPRLAPWLSPLLDGVENGSFTARLLIGSGGAQVAVVSNDREHLLTL